MVVVYPVDKDEEECHLSVPVAGCMTVARYFTTSRDELNVYSTLFGFIVTAIYLLGRDILIFK